MLRIDRPAPGSREQAARTSKTPPMQDPKPMEAGQMFRPRKRALGTALIMMLTLVVIAGCSATGGKRAAERAAAAAAGGGSSGHANTPRFTVAVITHAAPGDTVSGIIRAGAS